MRSRLAATVLATVAFWNITAWAQTNFAVLAGDGAWTWFNDPRALFYNGTLYFGYVRASDGRSALNTFNLQSGQTSNLWTSSLTQTDDHDNAGLLAKQDGTLLAIYSRHQSDQFFTYRLSGSTNPVSAADWGAERTNNTGMTVGVGMTYANPLQLTNENGKIYNFGRYQNYNPNVFTSTNGGTNWSTPQLLIQTGSGSTRPYVKYCSDSSSRIDILYTDAHPDNYTNSLYHLYYQGGAFYKTDGTFLKNYSSLPILHDSGERGSVVYLYSDAASSDPNQWIATGRAWCWETAYQTNGAPVCVFSVKVDAVTGSAWSDARIYYYYARWTGTNWQKRFIAQAGRPLYNGQPDYAGGICLDPQNPNTIYLSTDAASPFDLSTTTNVPLGSHYEIWKGVTTDGGLTFSWQATTTNSTMDNLRPYIPRRNGGEPCVLWFRGTYTSYISFSTQVVGLFTTKVPQTNAVSGTWSADADGVWSDNDNWSSGLVADGASNTADFSALDLTADRTVTLDSPRTIGALKFGDTSGAQNWRLTGSQLTLSAVTPAIAVAQNVATVECPLAGTNGFTKSGPGTLILSGSNSLTGVLNLDRGIDGNNNDGATRVTSGGAVANVASIAIRNTSVNTAGGATLQLDGSAGSVTVAQNITSSCRNNGTTPTFENVAGSNTLAGTIQFFTGGTNVNFSAAAGSQLVFSGSLQYVGSATAGRNFSFFGGGDVFVSGPILNSTNGAPIHLVKSGTGTLTLTGANTFTNGFDFNGGSVTFSTLANLGTGALNFGGGTLQFAPGNTADISVRTVTFNAAGGVLDTGTNTVTFAKGVGNGGSGRLTKLGDGTLVLAGTNSYTGGTTVSNGTVLVNGALGAGAVTVAGGALGGNGYIAGPVTVLANATFAPGASAIGTLTISNSLLLQGTTAIEINHAGGTNDLIRDLGSVTYGGTLSITNLAGTLTTNDTFKIFDATTYSGVFQQIKPQFPGTRLAWNTNRLATDGTLRLASRSPAPPTLGRIGWSGTNLTIAGFGGEPFGYYYILTSTNLALALASWMCLATNAFDANGNIAFTNPLNPAVPSGFFVIQLP
jgi:autotransporter-associated beta strand protein